MRDLWRVGFYEGFRVLRDLGFSEVSDALCFIVCTDLFLLHTRCRHTPATRPLRYFEVQTPTPRSKTLCSYSA